MTNGVSSIGVSAGMSDEADADLKAIYTGGENYLARMQAMSSRREQLQQSLSDLQLGIEAKTALDQAKAKNDEAQKQLEKAQAALTSAEAEAQRIADDARRQADRKVAEAFHHAEAVRKEADALREAVRTETAQSSQQAAALLQDAHDRNAEANAVRNEARETVTAANDAQQRAHAVRTDYEQRLKHVVQAVNELMAKIREHG